MDKKVVEYVVSNGRHAATYLEFLAAMEDDRRISNMITNHAIAVSSLINLVNTLWDEKTRLERQYHDVSKALEEIKRGELQRVVNERLDQLKEQLLNIITDFPEYYD